MLRKAVFGSDVALRVHGGGTDHREAVRYCARMRMSSMAEVAEGAEERLGYLEA